MAEASPPGSDLPAFELHELITARCISQAIAAAADLRLADALAAGPKHSREIAEQVDADADMVLRLMRALASVGIFRDAGQGCFEQTAMSELLRSDVPDSLWAYALLHGTESMVTSWSHLASGVRSGEPAFREVYGMSPIERDRRDPASRQLSVDAMRGKSAMETPALLAAYDFGSFASIVDVGGGDGGFLCAILDRYPGPRGVLFDLPDVIDGARKRITTGRHGGRIELAGGSFFEAVPAGGELYVLKGVVQGRSDDEAAVVLGNCRRAATPLSRLLVIEPVLGSAARGHWAEFSDLNMMVGGGGRHRTEVEHSALLRQASFRLTNVIPTELYPSIVEAVAS